MKKFVVVFEAWNNKHEQDCMCCMVNLPEKFNNALDVETRAEIMVKTKCPKFDHFQILYVKELQNG